MRIIIWLLLILMTIVLAGSEPCTPVSSALMSNSQMAAAAGAGFWGGMICGAAVMATIGAGAAIITAIGAGTTVGLGVAFAFSAALHVDAVCALL